MQKPVGHNTTILTTNSPEELVDCYRSSLEAMNRSPKTISWYTDILKRYFAFLKTNNLLVPVNQLGSQELKSYILHLQKAKRWANNPHIKEEHKGKLSAYSIQGHVRAVKAFWSWLFEEGYIDNNPLAKFPLPKIPYNITSTLTTEQIRKLLSGIDRSSRIGARQYCILLLLLDSGIRVSELVHLKLDDLDLQHNLITVLGKGQKQRCVPITRPTKKQLIHYISSCRPILCQTDSPYVFPAHEGEYISINSVQQFLKRLGKRAGLSGVKCSPHVFRHTFATHALANGANVLVLKDIMGHESLATTNKYCHLRPEDIQKQHSRFSPVIELFPNRS